ncbi:MAG: SPFH/Band 7/PHB domain protein [Methanomassiliicoccaceae archaeon]|jgi:regulator of protease activity HflC (stomatin/prohibitin superfamily)|nr:SPFH/Band 7/PHB domain protein [Methanomassiliicoccaceae archaeon]
METELLMVLGFIVIAGVLVSVVSGVKIVKPYEQAIYMRLGKYIRVLNQGLNFVCPLINTVVKLDLRTQVLDVPSQEVITKDNSPVNVDAIIYIKVTDPKNAFFEVTDYRMATVYLAQTTLRSVIGEMDLDDILSSRERINIQLRDILDESTDKWGVKVEAVEIRELDPAKKVKEAMEEQTSSERKRRAAILQADGLKRAAILEAEGKKKSRILEAEGLRQSMILEAEGKRLAVILEGQGDAQRLRIMAVGAAALDSKAMSVLSMETLKAVGEGESSKFFFPIELTKLVDGISQYMGTASTIPERSLSEIKDMKATIGDPDDILGPIPKAEDIRAQMDTLDKQMDAELKETNSLAQNTRTTDKSSDKQSDKPSDRFSDKQE